jgi:hypothetical protein
LRTGSFGGVKLRKTGSFIEQLTITAGPRESASSALPFSTITNKLSCKKTRIECKNTVLDLDTLLSEQSLFLGFFTTKTFLPVLVLRDLLCFHLLISAR